MKILRALPSADSLEWLIVDDGSIDRMVEVAKESGLHLIVKLARNSSLAKAFSAGLKECLKLGADVILNTYADKPVQRRMMCPEKTGHEIL
jgi:glycosyltransferase involved in cell wall biosynthesis